MNKLMIFGSLLFFLLIGSNGYSTSNQNAESVKQKTITYVNGYRIVKGERPQINLDKISSDAYEKGKIQIKLRPDTKQTIADVVHTATINGYVETNIESVNRLNQQYKATQYIPLMNGLYDKLPVMTKNREKHRAWGFHLWFEIEIDAKADVKEVVRAYAALDEVEMAEPVYKKVLYDGVKTTTGAQTVNASSIQDQQVKWTPNDPRFNDQWHYHNTGQMNGIVNKDIDLPEAWEIETGHSSVIVAIIDGGIQINHPDLQSNIWSGVGYNFVANSTTIVPHNHGTHVAGTIAASSNNGAGVSGIAGGTGLGDGVRLMSCQVFTASSSGGFGQAPIYAADNGAAISQNSWGYQSPNVYDQPSLDAIDYFNANGGGNVLNQGITIFAAGNSNDDALYYPGCYSAAFSVAATNNQDQRSWYSNYADWIEISAPGGETNSVTARGVLSSIAGNGYDYYQGTSMACPHVSGVAALLVSNAFRNGEILSSQDIWDLLVDNVENHYGSNLGYIGKLGSGRLNALNSLNALQDILSGIMNPQTFAAIATSSSQVDLTWTKNSETHNVMIVYSTSSTFGIPDSGAVYTVGDALADGGIVLYRGSETSFNHMDLDPATHYFYRAHSYSVDNEYSTGRSVNAITFCAPFELPYYQGFETGLPVCWEQEYVEGNIDWEFGSGNGNSSSESAYEGFKNAYFKGSYYDDGKKTRLVSPQYDLTPYMNIELTFQLYNKGYSGSQDTLVVMFKNAFNGEWVALQTFSTSMNTWTEIVVEIPQESITSDFHLSLLAISGGGNGVCVDGLLVEGQPLGPYANFIADSRNSLTGVVVNFTDASDGAEFEQWEWDFGQDAEPNLATGVGPHSVIYFTPGFKTITLTVDDSLSKTRINYVKIDQNPNPVHRVFYAALDVNGRLKAKVDNVTFTSGAGILAGKNINFEATPNQGYKVKSWKVNGNLVSDSNDSSFVLTQLGATTSVFVEFEETVGMNQIAGVPMFLYPNPARQQLSIERSESTPALIEIISIDGSKLSSIRWNSEKIDIDVHALPVGIYYIRLVTDQEIEMSKFIKN
ncbi:MAG: S8 family serine peptidase [Salinivirgaceae bacterium]|nr:S8 family serine peptidase [Salinivirgaceae bacterium]